MKKSLLGVYAVKDQVSERFGLPQFMDNEEVAKRTFQMMCEEKGTLIHYRPTDFDLYFLGSYDPLEGLIKATKPVKIMTGLECSAMVQGAPAPINK